MLVGIMIAAICIVIAIIMFSLPNSRSAQVQSFNEAVERYYQEERPFVVDGQWTGEAGQVGRAPGSLVFWEDYYAQYEVRGTHDLVPGSSATYITLIPSYNESQPPGAEFKVYLGQRLGWLNFTRPYEFRQNVSEPIDCELWKCRGCPNDPGDRDTCTRRDLEILCREAHNAEAHYEGRAPCDQGPRECGTCHYQRWAVNLCAVVDVDVENRTVNLSSTKFSCRYPFGVENNVYSTSIPHTRNPTTGVVNSSVVLQIRSSNDPYIIMQEMTSGSFDFGWPRVAQNGVGISMLTVAGAVGVPSLILLFVALLQRAADNRIWPEDPTDFHSTIAMQIRQQQQQQLQQQHNALPRPGHDGRQNPLQPHQNEPPPMGYHAAAAEGEPAEGQPVAQQHPAEDGDIEMQSRRVR